MATAIQSNFRIRKNLGRIQRVIEVPNLIDIQKSSYDKFLQSTIPQNDRQETGLQAVFRSVFPIKDFNGTSELVFVSYNLEKPKYDVDECRQRGMTFAISTPARYAKQTPRKVLPRTRVCGIERQSRKQGTAPGTT